MRSLPKKILQLLTLPSSTGVGFSQYEIQHRKHDAGPQFARNLIETSSYNVDVGAPNFRLILIQFLSNIGHAQ